MHSKHLRFIGIFLTLGLISFGTLGLAACSSKKASTTLSTSTSNAIMLTTTTSTATQAIVTTTAITTTTTSPLSFTSTTSTPTYPLTTTSPTVPTTTVAAFPYQGSGNGTWSGQATINNTTYQISGTMTISINADGNLTGSITSNKTGGTVPTTITAQIDPNGNLTGTVSFTVDSINFVTIWQGKITVAGTSLSIQGTWTGSYNGSGIFSVNGTTSN